MDCDKGIVLRASEAETIPHATEICEEIKTGNLPIPVEEDSHSKTSIQNMMLDHLANSKVACFKSQQIGEPELSCEQKRQIAKDILICNPGQFLSRFGKFLQAQHLDYFTESDNLSENYEVTFHLKELRRFHCKDTNEIDVKNRRFEALKKLVKEGIYFSEKEMKQRNPLLYQQLVGQYLTEKEVEDRKNADRKDINSWVNLLMAQIERDQMLCLRKQQKDDEDGAVEEMDTSDEEQEEEDEDDDYDEDENNESGSCDEQENHDNGSGSCSSSTKKRKHVAGKEKDLLREEFVSNMYRSFLEGRDEEFDYSQVDLNPEYECLALRSQDEEEKYFDSETPELVAIEQPSDEEEDELDVYMKNLKPDFTPSDLAGNFSIML